MRAVILAGGKGVRLLPFTKFLPKSLLPIGNQASLIDVILFQIKNSGIKDVVICLGHFSKVMQAYLSIRASEYGLNIDYVIEDQQLGTAGPLSLVQKYLSSTFILINGDVITNLNLGEFIKYHKSLGGIASVAVAAKEVHVEFGVIEYNSSRMTSFIEKPTYTYTVCMGVYVFEPDVFNFLSPCEFLNMNTLISMLLKENEQVNIYRFDGYWKDIGRLSDYEQAVSDYQNGKLMDLDL